MIISTKKQQDYTQKDTFQHFEKIVKDAGFLPPWLQLKKEIASLLHEAETESDIEEINKKVKKYNRMCPNPLQKMSQPIIEKIMVGKPKSYGQKEVKQPMDREWTSAIVKETVQGKVWAGKTNSWGWASRPQTSWRTRKSNICLSYLSL